MGGIISDDVKRHCRLSRVHKAELDEFLIGKPGRCMAHFTPVRQKRCMAVRRDIPAVPVSVALRGIIEEFTVAKLRETPDAVGKPVF